ncbi:hypothetical protein ABGT92_23785 [Streptomyces cinereoruber]|uniref:hypothetical protein n=1 Tax=Streptomyces cinereoruber TaxID=67260 RepID=UPI00345D591A
MGLFNRRKSTAPARVPSPEEIDEAGRLLAAGDSKLADKLADGAGEHSQWVAMQILSACVDHTPQES